MRTKNRLLKVCSQNDHHYCHNCVTDVVCVRCHKLMPINFHLLYSRTWGWCLHHMQKPWNDCSVRCCLDQVVKESATDSSSLMKRIRAKLAKKPLKAKQRVTDDIVTDGICMNTVAHMFRFLSAWKFTPSLHLNSLSTKSLRAELGELQAAPSSCKLAKVEVLRNPNM